MAKRGANGRFMPGQSGNPQGRPSRSDELRRLMQGEADEVARSVLKAAREGDIQAARLVLERCVPAIKPQAEPVSFPLAGDTLTQKAESVLTAVSAGALDPITGKALIDAITSLARTTEIDEILTRLAKLEGTP